MVKWIPSVLRTLRYITFGKYTPSYDGAYFLDKKVRETEDGEMYLHEMDSLYPMLLTEDRTTEEWPSEKWNFQDNYGKTIRKVHAQSNPHAPLEEGDESEESSGFEEMIILTEKKVKKTFTFCWKALAIKKLSRSWINLIQQNLYMHLKLHRKRSERKFRGLRRNSLLNL